MEAPWRIELLGGLRAVRGEEVVTHFRTRKAAELLAFLAYQRHRTHSREVLIELLWPECNLQAGRHNLSMALTLLRHLLEPAGVPAGSVIVADRYSAGLDPRAVVTDVALFEAALLQAARVDGAEKTRRLAAALEAYGGELLPGFYEDWVGPEQQRLDELFFDALYQLVARLERAGDLRRALQYALRGLGANRLREEAHREVIRLYGLTGQPEAALRQYRELERILEEWLDRPPSPATRALLREIRASRSGASAPPAIPAAGEPREPAALTPSPASADLPLESVGGAVPLNSRFYVDRPADAEFQTAVAHRDSIVLVKGPRQVGKTSLLARGLHHARDLGARIVVTHFQVFNAAHLESAESFLLTLAEMLAAQLELEVPPGDVWKPRLGPNLNFSYFFRREVLEKLAAPLVWALDEVDRLFTCPFGSEVFGLFRSWHDERALVPDGPWSRLTLALAYSTEAHLFITDVNQSPFNVGTRLALEDFTEEQVADLNHRYGAPLKSAAELRRFTSLVGGHPYLARRGLHELAARGTPLAALEARAADDDWIFGEHLRRILVLLARDPELTEALRAVFRGRPCSSRESFSRLRSAGLLLGDSPAGARPRCALYARFLAARLPERVP